MTPHPVHRRKKLIEVAIPLEAINAASAREKSIRHGHPSTLHLWWARRPLAAARAVIFCQMVDDPSAVPEEFPTEEAQEHERLRLFALISELVTWENTTNEQVLNRARAEIRRSWRRACADNADHPEAAELFNPEKLPGFHDPFAGGGALPLEAQRLGLEAYASDLNPVAVLINKAMIEIPPKFAGLPPVNPESRRKLDVQHWKGAQGLADDVRYYGKWMRDEAEKRIGHLYPKVEVTAEMAKERPDLNPYVGKKLTVIAWLWARTVKSPNPAFAQVDVPLASTFMLSTKTGKETYVEVIPTESDYRFCVKVGRPVDSERAKNGTKLSRGANFVCVMSGEPISSDYIKAQGQSGNMGARLMGIVAQVKRGRVYLSPLYEHQKVAQESTTEWKPEQSLPDDQRNFWTVPYGIKTYGDLFTQRQLTGLSVLCQLITEAIPLIREDALATDMNREASTLSEGGRGAIAYAEAMAVYLAFALDKTVGGSSSICTWMHQRDSLYHTFAKQCLPMTWDFAEVNILADCTRSISESSRWTAESIEGLLATNNAFAQAHAFQADACNQGASIAKVVSTDPPYYDNIGYADLSDFYYAWLRQTLRTVYPDLFSTIAVPKAEELVATPYRHGGKEKAEAFFLDGMTHAMTRIAQLSHQGFPVTIYYAFKQAETKQASGTKSTGWETFLSAIIQAELAITGTWPMRTERETRSIGIGTNALASSVVLVCQRRLESAITLSRTDFRRQLRQELPKALQHLERANIAPVDVAQAAIGPGMAIYSSAKAVLNPDDSPMSVREALIEINTALDEYLSQDEGDLDADSRFALTFYESFGYKERDFGDAEGLAKARNLSVAGVAEAGILRSVAGKVRLLPRSELPGDWDPTTDRRLCVWEATQQLIKRLEADGEDMAADLLLQLKSIPGHGDLAANCRALAYRLYNHCEKSKQAEEARSYNGMVIAWPELEKRAAATSTAAAGPQQLSMV
jgi:putative DNA methylase